VPWDEEFRNFINSFAPKNKKKEVSVYKQLKALRKASGIKYVSFLVCFRFLHLLRPGELNAVRRRLKRLPVRPKPPYSENLPHTGVGSTEGNETGRIRGPLHQVHWGGHEKLSSQELQIGDGIGFGLYGGRCAWTGRAVWLALVPDVHCPRTLGHIYLDCIEAEGYGWSFQQQITRTDYFETVIPHTNVVNKGTHVGHMVVIQNQLRYSSA
jgi:hypothetical protein